MPAGPREDAALLAAAYAPLLALCDHLVDLVDTAAPTRDAADAADAAETLGWTPTALPGWTVRDLLFHLASDAQRALVALFTPAGRPGGEAPDTDAASYWTNWTPGTPGAQAGLRATRTIASQWSGVDGPADLFRTTARALLQAVAGADPDAVVATQGHTLRVRDLVSTLVVEAAVHSLDLPAATVGATGLNEPVQPDPAALAEVRRVTTVLLGEAVPAAVDDARWALLATGRTAPDDVERRALGPAAQRLPLFG